MTNMSIMRYNGINKFKFTHRELDWGILAYCLYTIELEYPWHTTVILL